MSGIVFNDKICVICRTNLDLLIDNSPWVQLTLKGLETLAEYSSKRCDDELTDFLASNPSVVNVHTDCRKRYTCKRRYEQEKKHADDSQEHSAKQFSKLLRSSGCSFNWKQNCFLCSKDAIFDERHPDRSDMSCVRTLELQKNALQAAQERSDQWAWEVQGRLETCNDLVAEEAVYHRQCLTLFLLKRPAPIDSDINCGNRSTAAWRDEQKLNVFNRLCEWLEVVEDKLYTISELHEIMRDIAGPKVDIYSERHLKDMLLEKYKEHLVLSQVAGRKNVVCFKNMAASIINDKWYNDKRSNIDEEMQRIVVAAARLVRSEIREMEHNSSTYPTSDSFHSVDSAKKWVPSLLMAFMEQLVGVGLKSVALSHAIVQASCPRSAISPVLFGLGVSLDHAFASKWLLETLSKLGFSSSYDEISRYKQCVVRSDDDLDLPCCYPAGFTQWSGDNVDHNIITLDGAATFHGMGIISMTTPISRLPPGNFSEAVIQRLHRSKGNNVIKNKGIELLPFCASENACLSTLLFKPIQIQQLEASIQSIPTLDLLWHAGYFCNGLRPNWSGFMQDAVNPVQDFPPAADIRMLPIIDLNPNSMPCLYSTLCFVEKQAERMNMKTACITFDQPLWIKAVEIVQAKLMNVVCRLGGFHTIMSFLGSIGKVMEGSGIVEALQSCYGPVAVGHMLSGKAEARAVRGHILIQSALYIILLGKISDIDTLKPFYESIASKAGNVDSDELQNLVQHLDAEIVSLKEELSSKSRTAKLWLQYMEYVQILKDFIRAERVSNWNLHLVSLSKMLNLFAATGHRHYAKSARLYLQMMLDLPQTHPWLHEQLSINGLHAVRRSDRYWAGLSTDLIIEQVMMRSIKSRGGLTHGRGMTDSVRLVWVKSMHRCATVHAALGSLIDTKYTSAAVQHVEMGKSRKQRDASDLKKMIAFFESTNPFCTDEQRLRCLSSGKIAAESDNVNCDNAELVGQHIMLLMDNVTYTDVSIKKAHQVKTLSDVIAKSVGGTKKLPIDSTILFSRLITIVQRSIEMEPYFKYELTAVPTALFKDATSIRKTDKSVLAKELVKNSESVGSVASGTKYVVDGGWLLHKVKWQQGGLFKDAIQQYVNYVGKHFAQDVTVVFDGYQNGPTTKDHEHDRRALKSAPDIVFDITTPVCYSQSLFLANESNKKAFVELLMHTLHERSYIVNQAHSDADTLIVATALQIAESGRPVTVVANDTDVLVLLLYHCNRSSAEITLQSETRKHMSSQIIRRSISQLSDSLGCESTSLLLVAHAISGCDTTSAVFGCGKINAWKRIAKHPDSSRLTEIISSYHASREEIASAGLKMLSILYCGNAGQSLNHLRYTTYMNIIATSSLPPRPERLPPTENAGRYHIYRVHLQVVQWKSLMAVDKNPEEWGWKVIDGRYFAVDTDLNAAPSDLLDVIRCRCKTDANRPCSTQMCTCVKHGLPCLPACKNCNGEVCENKSEDACITDDVPDLESVVDETWPLAADDIIPEDCESFDIPWIDEEVVEYAVL